MGIDKYNAEGYYDPTTYNALTNIHRDEMAADKKAASYPLVYICSPYAGDTVRNVANVKNCGCLGKPFLMGWHMKSASQRSADRKSDIFRTKLRRSDNESNAVYR